MTDAEQSAVFWTVAYVVLALAVLVLFVRLCIDVRAARRTLESLRDEFRR